MADIEPCAWGVHIGVETLRPAALDEVRVEATGLMLLRVGSAVRLARPWVRTDGAQVSAGWEVWRLLRK